MQGLHPTADLLDCQCDPAWLTDAARLLGRGERAALLAGLQPVARLAHTLLELFDPGQLQRQALQRGRQPPSAKSTP